MTTCPNIVNCVHVSRTTRPVTQVALVAVNIASTTLSRPLRLRGQRQQQRAQRDQQHKAHADDLGRIGAHQQAFAMCFLFCSFSHEELLLPPRQPWRFRGGIVLARCAAGVLFIGYTFFLFPST